MLLMSRVALPAFKRSSAVADRPRDASCLSSLQLSSTVQYLERAVFYYPPFASIAKGEVFVLLYVFCLFVRSTISRQPAGRFTPKFACRRTLVPDVSTPLLGLAAPGGRKKGQMKFSLLWESMGNFCILAVFERYLSNACTDPH